MIDIEKANAEALERMMAAHPVLIGVGRALEVIPGMRWNLFLHAGPPLTWERMCGPMKGALIGAVLLEGLAEDAQEAQALAQSGKIHFEPCHHHGAVGPMAGVISPSMQVYIVEDRVYGNQAYSNMNEGRGKVLRMGAYSPEVIERLRWLNTVFGPRLDAAIRAAGGLDLRTLIAKALHMGDDGHNRLDAASLLFAASLAPHVVSCVPDAGTAFQVVKFLGENPICSLNALMAACKCMADAGHGVQGSTVVTAMARNGVEFGIRVSGMGNRWFTGPASLIDGVYLPGFSAKDANPDIGDSTITETAGIGGFAMACAPAIVTLVGGTAKDAIRTTLDMYEITAAEHKFFSIPALDFRGTPTGIDVRKVIEKNLPPRVNTGIAHREPGIGQVGAGIVTPPMSVFEEALVAFAEQYGYGKYF